MMLTREKLKELLPIMQAFAEGKSVEYMDSDGLWWKTENPIWEDGTKYRIQPEIKYRPFKTVDECWDEMHKHPDFGWIKSKHNGNYSDISTMYKSCKEERIMVANSSYTLAQAFEIFIFPDGTPFGMIEEE